MRLARRSALAVFKGGRISPDDGEMFFATHRKSSVLQLAVPLTIAFLLHIIIIGMTVSSPINLFRRQKPIQVTTVNLFRVSDIQPALQSAAQPPSVAADKPSAKEEIISLAPKKIKKKNLKSKAEEKKREDLLSKRFASLKADLEAQKAKKQAREAAKKAVESIAKSYHGAQEVGQQGPVSSSTPLTEAQRMYLASVKMHIDANWVLPNLPTWSEDLEAIVVLKIDRTGKILKSFFEQKTDNSYFNKFVEKTIGLSDPLPSFPEQIVDKEMEIGLRFKPGEIL